MIREWVGVCSLSIELFLGQLRQAFILVSFSIFFTPMALSRIWGALHDNPRILGAWLLPVALVEMKRSFDRAGEIDRRAKREHGYKGYWAAEAHVRCI